MSIGCATVTFPLPDESSRITSPSTLLERIAARRDRILNVSATGRISSRSPEGALAGRLTASVTSAGLVRLDAWTPTWDLVGSFVGDPEGFVYYVRGGQCLMGGSTPETIAAILPLGLDYDAMTRILAGSPPVADGLDWIIDWDRKSGAWLLSGHNSDGKSQKIWADADGVTRRFVMMDDGRRIDVVFDDFVTTGGERMASKTSIAMNKNTTTVIFREIEVNAGVTPEDFEQRCPDGVPGVFIQ